MEEEKIKLIKNLNNAGIDIDFVIQEAFLGYKYRKASKKLYEEKAEIPTKLIRMYYNLTPHKISFDNMKKAFIKRYINNESELEGINSKDIHNKVELEGLKVMYEYIHSDEINYMFDVYTLKDLHSKLFSLAEHPEYAGDFRNYDVYLPGSGTNLTEWSAIRPELNKIDIDVQDLIKEAQLIKENCTADQLLNYLDKCVVIGCRLIKVHPFADGNGRTIRGFINKLLEDVGLPPIYIKVNERTEYHTAMNIANNEENYDFIKGFYRYKVCDSIIELDINERLKAKNANFKENPIKQKNKKLQK